MSGNVLLIDMSEAFAKKTITCDSCKSAVNIKKPKKDEPPNDGIKAELKKNAMGETQEYHFCNEACLLSFLQERNKVN